MFEGVTKVLSTVKTILGINSIDEAIDVINNKPKTREQEIQLITLQNENIDSAREREVEIAKVDPRGNRPLYAVIYSGLLIWLALNGAMFFDQSFKDAVVPIDVLGIGGIFGYLLGKNN